MKISTILLMAVLILVSSLYAQDSHKTLTIPKMNESQSDNQFPAYGEINTEVLSKLVQSANPLIMIVDARNIKTDNGKRIPSAKTIPFDATIENITANLPDKQAMVIIYCSNAKCPASCLLADRLVRMGYKNVWKYPGGLEEWEASGQKVENGKTAAQSAAETGPKSA